MVCEKEKVLRKISTSNARADGQKRDGPSRGKELVNLPQICPRPERAPVKRSVPPKRKEELRCLRELASGLRGELVGLGLEEVRLRCRNRTGGALWASRSLATCEVLLIIIPGSGSEYPGPWSTISFCREAGTESGSVLPYVRRATENGWGVALLCPNANVDDDGRPLAGSENPCSHAVSAWDDFLAKCSANTVLMVAHSNGGQAAIGLLCDRKDDLVKGARLKTVALLDSVHKSVPSHDTDVLDFCKTRVVDFVRSREPVGSYRPKPWAASNISGGCRCRSGGHVDHLGVPGAVKEVVFDHFIETLSPRNSAATKS
eukprot:CAMPEP_0181309438 /NCGR_PEP_ID=MMETSP1101-20121128/12012_1 /TAXON_ID=46948 /ORGANISM="Rhodomonas abbreviata, Strain Caron Lab Isolate" /LENGTH=316 /DNA_ID=CAMNT_0023415919 /DNA_START=86 /DNA_END=1036 /DNA_ORIENTATION=+